MVEMTNVLSKETSRKTPATKTTVAADVAIDQALSYLMTLGPEAKWGDVSPCIQRLIGALSNDGDVNSQRLGRQLEDQHAQWHARFRTNLGYGSRREVARQLLELHKTLDRLKQKIFDNGTTGSSNNPKAAHSLTHTTFDFSVAPHTTTQSYFVANSTATCLTTQLPSMPEQTKPATPQSNRPGTSSAAAWLSDLFNQPFRDADAEEEITNQLIEERLSQHLSTQTNERLLKLRKRLAREGSQFSAIAEDRTELHKTINRCIIALAGGSKIYDILPLHVQSLSRALRSAIS